jgi:hypothetical protein
MDGQHDTLGGPAESHTSQPDLTAGYIVSDKTGYLFTIILCLGKTIKPFFLLPLVHCDVKLRLLYRVWFHPTCCHFHPLGAYLIPFLLSIPFYLFPFSFFWAVSTIPHASYLHQFNPTFCQFHASNP